MISQKGQTLFFVLVGILVIAGIAAGAYYLGRQISPKPSPTPVITSQTSQLTPDETANWKTYQSAKYGYEFKYPSDWKLEELPSPMGGDFLQAAVSCIDCDSEYVVNFFSISPVDYKSFEEYLSDRKKGNDLVSAIGEYQRIKIGNLDAIKAADPGICNPGTDACQNSGIEYFVLNGTKGYLVSEGYKDLKHIKKLNQFPTPKPNILSTFRFQ